jgi:hypothetical protein
MQSLPRRRSIVDAPNAGRVSGAKSPYLSWAGGIRGSRDVRHSQSHDPGLTYDRARIAVAVRIVPAACALAEEARLRPRDNLLGQPADDDQCCVARPEAGLVANRLAVTGCSPGQGHGAGNR